MGRDAGWLTSASALARNEYNTAPHLIYLPEAPFDTAQFLADVKELLKKQNTVIIAVSEGIRDKNGNYISAASQTTDGFGHSHLSGAGKALENFVTSNIDIKVRSIEINVLQRSGAHISSAIRFNRVLRAWSSCRRISRGRGYRLHGYLKTSFF